LLDDDLEVRGRGRRCRCFDELVGVRALAAAPAEHRGRRTRDGERSDLVALRAEELELHGNGVTLEHLDAERLALRTDEPDLLTIEPRRRGRVRILEAHACRLADDRELGPRIEALAAACDEQDEEGVLHQPPESDSIGAARKTPPRSTAS
jgi:hypothetical protein